MIQQGGMMMISKKDEQSFDIEQMEIWLENYFLDPLTSYYDQTQFQIDLYETDKEWIVEALLSDYQSSDITVYVEDEKLIVTGKKNFLPSKINQKVRSRTIEFPFLIKKQKISAVFKNGILEILISKLEKGIGKNRFIALS